MKLFKKIISHPERNSLFLNFTNYGIYSLSLYIVPLITLPYIIRVVGLEKFGIISLALAVSNYLRIVADYGWSTLGVQYIARKQKSAKETSTIISTILTIQLLLMMVTFISLAGIGYFIPSVHSEYFVFLVTFGLVPSYLLTASWFYVGMEKVKFLNYINFLAKGLYLFFIFFFLRNEDQYYLVPVLNSISLFIGALFSIILMRQSFGIRFQIPTVENLKSFLKDGWPIFVSSFAGNFYRNSNIIILAFFVAHPIVGIYAAADKIIRVFQGTFAPITQTLYPYISRIMSVSYQRAEKAIIALGSLMSIISAIIITIIFFTAEWIMYLIVDQHTVLGTLLLRIGIPTILFGVVNYILGIIYMTNFGLKQYYSKAVLMTGLINLILCTSLSNYFGATGAMLSFTISEFSLLLMLLGKTVRTLRTQPERGLS